jgi:hypothetical protein
MEMLVVHAEAQEPFPAAVWQEWRAQQELVEEDGQHVVTRAILLEESRELIANVRKMRA